MVMEGRDLQAFIRIVPLYFLQSFFFGVWFSAIPLIEENRGISNSTLGDYLSIAVIGAILAMPLAPYMHDYLGSRITDMLGFFIVGAALIVLSNSTIPDAGFGFGMVMYGFAIILIFSSTFAQAAVLEKATHQLWMGVFSASAGLGGMVGAIAGGYGMEYTELEVWEVVSLLICAMYITLLVLYPYLYTYEEERKLMAKDVARREKAGGGLFEKLLCSWAESWQFVCFGAANLVDVDGAVAESEQETEPILTREQLSSSASSTQQLERQESEHSADENDRDWSSMAILCLIAGLSFFVEGSIGDWGGVYLERRWDCGALIGVMGYIVEKAAIVLGGLFSDYLSTHVISRYWLLQLSIVMTSLGFFVAGIANEFPATNGSLALAIFGFGVAGGGLGLLVPTWYSISGRGIRGFSVSETGAIVMTFANTCWLIEPLGMGNLADATGSLAYAFHFEAALTLLIIAPAALLPRHYYKRPKKRSSNPPAQESAPSSGAAASI